MDRLVTVLHKDAEVPQSKGTGFYNDALDVRAITCLAVGFLLQLLWFAGMKPPDIRSADPQLNTPLEPVLNEMAVRCLMAKVSVRTRCRPPRLREGS